MASFIAPVSALRVSRNRREEEEVVEERKMAPEGCTCRLGDRERNEGKDGKG